MTEEERDNEGAEEQAEDMQAPAEVQDDVAGGACSAPTCGKPSTRCGGNTCVVTAAYCTEKSNTHDNVVYEQ